ncbi:uncharacterized protein EV420DRAFT_1486176 [Desarmillaria tabescens]|uniref:Uncharacterized protein n=1 Tax=Armillaria tabescens TaxID=1929756 RepID=A0AA39JFR1_ARMTA|nr:uncharacterized protein EV420DRAFT_1486176 [Desarmillaria tabescens]KAK0439723.1 hypothetical protein EV420DRAFT_1486176 [Desarmillaria tabescens]
MKREGGRMCWEWTYRALPNTNATSWHLAHSGAGIWHYAAKADGDYAFVSRGWRKVLSHNSITLAKLYYPSGVPTIFLSNMRLSRVVQPMQFLYPSDTVTAVCPLLMPMTISPAPYLPQQPRRSRNDQISSWRFSLQASKPLFTLHGRQDAPLIMVLDAIDTNANSTATWFPNLLHIEPPVSASQMLLEKRRPDEWFSSTSLQDKSSFSVLFIKEVGQHTLKSEPFGLGWIARCFVKVDTIGGKCALMQSRATFIFYILPDFCATMPFRIRASKDAALVVARLIFNTNDTSPTQGSPWTMAFAPPRRVNIWRARA